MHDIGFLPSVLYFPDGIFGSSCSDFPGMFLVPDGKPLFLSDSTLIKTLSN